LYSGANMHETRRGNIVFSQHAEMNALQKYLKSTYGKSYYLSKQYIKIHGKNPELYVVRLTGYAVSTSDTNIKSLNIDKDHECVFNNSMPCKHCQKNLFKFGIRTIKYTTIIDDQEVLCEMRCTK